jgi:hypothetical protein
MIHLITVILLCIAILSNTWTLFLHNKTLRSHNRTISLILKHLRNER